MDFNPSIWGTVGQWASAVITGSAFFATFYVIRRDAAVRRFSQARKVAYYVKPVKVSVYEPPGTVPNAEYIIKNMSDEPIYGVTYYYNHGPKRGRVLGSEEVVIPGEEVIFTTEASEDVLRENGYPFVWFRDNSGHFWNRSIDGFLRRGGGAISNLKWVKTTW
ncbi:hypothetical protein [Arthrobacter sp. B2a2-09]|uniref:hypothetical protein n=1 Tax=Arthrobacter sp. B2a2-09 TaxID=2952822 RepID=UPI0022CD27D2|nr:hypothetical protein [Arthrobacter sp. B2a2-09]MCZ9880539.1 hypothetical protein [Arthrobacter sp. B2a2-09]